MAVAGRHEGAHDAASFGMVRGSAFFGAGAGRPGLHLDDDRSPQVDQLLAGKRVQAQDGGGGETARARNAIRRAHLLPVQLGDAVDEIGKELRMRMLVAVPARIVSWLAQPEVGAEVDDNGSTIDEALYLCPGGAVG